MMELEDMLGMFPIGRVSRLGTSVLKGVRVSLKSSKRASKTGPPKICVGDVFNMGGDSIRGGKNQECQQQAKFQKILK